MELPKRTRWSSSNGSSAIKCLELSLEALTPPIMPLNRPKATPDAVPLGTTVYTFISPTICSRNCRLNGRLFLSALPRSRISMYVCMYIHITSALDRPAPSEPSRA